MAVPLRLEVFETAEMPDGPAFMMPDDIEELRLAAFERGFLAGYEDAGSQFQTEEAAMRARIAGQVETLNFGYHEARAHLLSALEPLLDAVTSALLPAISRAAIVPMVIEELLPLAASRLDAPLVLHVPPGSRGNFEQAFDGLVLPPLSIIEDGELDQSQAEIRTGTDESRIDLSAAITRIEAAMASHYHASAKEAINV